MSLTNPEDARNLLYSVDQGYYQALMRQVRSSFGEPWAGSDAPLGPDGDFPSFPDTRVRMLKPGESRRVLNNAVLTLSRVLTGDPEPDYPQLDSVSAEARKQVWLSRYQKRGWQSEMQSGFLDGDNMGVGFVQIGPRKNPKTGKMYADLQHIPVQRVLWDRHVRTPSRARWICFLHELAPDVVRQMYKGNAYAQAMVDKHTHTAMINAGVTKRAHKYVRLTEWWDLGIDGSDPSCAYWIGPWSGKPVDKRAHDYEQLPFAHMEYISVPGLAQPIGKVLLQQATVAMINEVEGRFRANMRRGRGFDIVDKTQLDTKDLAKLISGDDNVKVGRTAPSPNGMPAWERVPAAEIGQSDLQYLEMLERQYNSDSSSTEMDRSTRPPNGTATRDQLMDVRSQQGMTLTKVQALHFAHRVVNVWNMVAAEVDRDPLYIDVQGHKVYINDPSNSAVRMDKVMEEYSSMVISQQSLERTDLEQRNQMRLTQLFALLPMAQLGWIDPGWLRDQVLTAMGERDTQIAAPKPAAPQPGVPAGGQPGQPGQPGQQGMPPGPPVPPGPTGPQQSVAPALPPGMHQLPMVAQATAAGG